MNRFRVNISLFLVALYLFFFASCHLFYHTHFNPSSVVTHSHPGNSHTHTASELLLVAELTSELSEAPSVQNQFDQYLVLLCEIHSDLTLSGLSHFSCEVRSLRAPPYAA